MILIPTDPGGGAIGGGAKGETYTHNARHGAGSVAGAIVLSAILLPRSKAWLIPKESDPLTGARPAHDGDGTLSGGMIPQIETAVDAGRGRRQRRLSGGEFARAALELSPSTAPAL